MAKQKATATLTAQNTFTDEKVFEGDFNLSIIGTAMVGTLTLSRSFDDGATFVPVATYTADAQKVVKSPESGIVHKIGFETGDYTSGSVDVRLSN